MIERQKMRGQFRAKLAGRLCGVWHSVWRMRRRRGLSAAFCLFCVIGLLTGCQPLGSVDTLLQPPQLSEEQEQIYLALQDAVGSGITLQYPRTGTNLSAFTVMDLDDDGEDEALVFYKKTSLTAAENGLRLSVLDQVDGAWMSVFDRPAAGTEVERILICPLGTNTRNQIFVGYSGVDQSDKLLTVYDYAEADFAEIFQTPYTLFDVADLDGETGTELLVLRRFTDTASPTAAIYRMQSDGVKNGGELELRAGFTDFSQVLYGTLPDGGIGIYIDGSASGSTLQTEVLCVRGHALEYVLESTEILSRTARPVGYVSMDYDQDGTVEIPVQEAFPGYASDSSEQVRLTKFLVVSGTALAEQARGYFSLSDGCIFLLPPSWYGTVTAMVDSLSGDLMFCRYAGSIEDSTEVLLRYSMVQETELQEERLSDGYLLLHTRGKAAYYMQAVSTEDVLALPWETLVARFLFLS